MSVDNLEEDLQAIKRAAYGFRRDYVEAQQLESDVKRHDAQCKLRETVFKRMQKGAKQLHQTSLARSSDPDLPWSNQLARGKCLQSSSQSADKRSVAVAVLPDVEVLVPQYKAWTYLPRNELASRVGHKMFYTDSTGETVPASEDDEENHGDDPLEGIGRERELFVIRKVFQKHGRSQAVMEALASALGLSPGALKDLPGSDGGSAVPQSRSKSPSPVLTPTLDERMSRVYCRYCNTFCCLLHLQKPVRPMSQLSEDPSSSTSPCSKDCWLLCAGVDTNMIDSKPDNIEARNLRANDGMAPVADVDSKRTPAAAPGEQDRGREDSKRAPSLPPEGKALYSVEMALQAGVANGGYREGVHANGSLLHDDDLIQPSAKRRRLQSPPGGQGSKQSAGVSVPGFSAGEVELLRKGIRVFGKDACKVALLITSKTCFEVHLALQTEQLKRMAEEVPSVFKPRPAAARRPTKNKVAMKRAQHKQNLWEAFVPCACLDGCGPNCSCLGNAQFCEKYCACDKSCLHFFQGCVCTSGCRTKSCPCAAAGFECDPDLCQGCRSVALGGSPPEGKDECHNMRLRMRMHKRIAVGLSKIAGWGAFIMEPVKKNHLIGEYTGEVIDHEEADRRGKVYDKEDNSYLFNLNISWVIDARLRGNKLRFANHSKEPNCMAKILLVDGSHRVGIFAARDMRAGTELTYDYLYASEQAPEWARD